MPSISSLGIGSGLDLEGMLSQLQTAEETRVTPYTNLQNTYKAKISTWGQISGNLSSLQTSVKKLQTDAFNTMKISDNKAFTATATSEASEDSHSVTVQQLAMAHKISTEDSYQDADEDLGTADATRTITITQGNGQNMSIELADDETSLNDIAKAINEQAGGVSATVQHTDNGYQLVLNSKITGQDGEISVVVEGDSNLAGIMECTHGGDTDQGDSMHAITDAQDAKLTVDGSDFTRSSNNISDIITGVTLNLKSVSETEVDTDGNPKPVSEQLTLSKDRSAISPAIQDFVKQYNALLSTTSSASKYVPNDPDNQENNGEVSGPLVGDSLLRGLVGEVRSTVNGRYGDSDAVYSSLASIGITVDAATGQLTLDQAKLDEAIADNPDEMAAIFDDHNGMEGLASKFNKTFDEYLGQKDPHTDGEIKNATDALNEQVKSVQKQIDSTQKLVDDEMARYRTEFQNLDASMSQMQSSFSQVSGMLSQM